MKGDEPAADKIGCDAASAFTKHFAALLDREAQALGIDAGAPEHALDRNLAERLEEFLQSLWAH